MHKLLPLFCIFSIARGLEYGMLETFLEDVIDKWGLLSPTIIFQDEMPTTCMDLDWTLCLTYDIGIRETADHLDIIFKTRKQDGIIFVGDQGHQQVVRQLAKVSPAIFSSNCPVFMSTNYTNDIELRLDSNIIFYREGAHSKYELMDQFAVKGGPTITNTLGYWNMKEGIIIKTSMSRWERRTDLNRATFKNALSYNGYWAHVIKNKNGSIIGSDGWFQEMLFYITDKLNLTLETLEVIPKPSFPLENGSWTGLIGLLQRKEVDVLSMGLGINYERSFVIDYPLATQRQPITLIAGVPKGGGPNMWVYIQVFGVYQWITFVMLLTLMGAALSLLNIVSKDDTDRVSAYSSFAIVYFYVIQMGSHTSSRQLAARLLTLTASLLTLLIWIYYTNDITAKMTSGTPKIPIRTFDDVIYHDYKVISNSPYYASMLEAAGTGTAKNKVYNSYLEKIDGNNKKWEETWTEALNTVIRDPKTLYYAGVSVIVSDPKDSSKTLTDQRQLGCREPNMHNRCIINAK